MAILGCHPNIAVPEVAWYYPLFRPYPFTYGDLSDRENFRTLCHEMACGLKTPFWDMKVNPATFGDEITETAIARAAGGWIASASSASATRPKWFCSRFL
ncbi:MAG: hypothetical protein RIB59_08110 [Rhodospirillales bacterium]